MRTVFGAIGIPVKALIASWFVLWLGCVALLASIPTVTVLASSSGDTRTQQPVPAQDWYMVTDRAGILDQGQERLAINDAYRLYLNGIPTQVITEFAAFSQDQADSRARELRIVRGIESSRGANDGLVLYAAVHPRERDSVTISISVGGTALPTNGLTSRSLQEVRDMVLAPQLEAGNPARAIIYSLREVIYLRLYVPPAVVTVAGGMATLRRVLNVVSPVIAVVAGVWLVRRQSSGPHWEPASRTPLVAAGLAATVIALLSTPSQSAIGLFSALAIGLVAIWRAIQIDSRISPIVGRRVTVAPRVPGSRTASIRRSRSIFR